MRTQVIHLDPHDDLISIRDRMAWAKTPRILLVWPARGRVGVRPLDLTLLRRHAEALGAELGLVTRDGGIRSAAREMNLPVFRTAADAQKKPWPLSQPARPQRRAPRADLRALQAQLHLSDWFSAGQQDSATRVTVFTLGVLAVLVLMLIFIPSAEIRISAPEQVQSVTISVSAEAQASAVQLSGVIPARVRSLELDIADTILASGQVTVPQAAAEGMGLFTNLTEDPQTLPAGTVLLTRSDPPVAFLTVESAELPAGKGETVEIPIRAAAPGLTGNVPAESITAFEGPLGLLVEVTNPEAMRGGSEASLPAATDADREALRKRLLADLEQQARERLPQLLSPGDVPFPSSLLLVRVIEETFTPPAGQPGAKLTLSLKAEFSLSYATDADLQELAQRVLDASLPAGASSVPGPVKVSAASPLFGDGEIVRWQVLAERKVRPSVDAGQVISLVMGKTARRAGSLLTQSLGLEQPPQVSIRPAWWPWLPFLPIRITVTN